MTSQKKGSIFCPSCRLNNGTKNIIATIIAKLNLSNRTNGAANTGGNKPTATRPPSSGGSGSMLNTAKMTLILMIQKTKEKSHPDGSSQFIGIELIQLNLLKAANFFVGR